MVQYTADFLAAARQGYEQTDQPMRELARELGIGITTLSTLAEKHGWAKRSQRQRGLSPAMQLLAEVKALAEAAPHPSRLGEERLAPQDDGATLTHDQENPSHYQGTPSPTLPLSGGGSANAPDQTELLIKLEQILAQLIAAQHLAPSNGLHSLQASRNLTALIHAMRTLQGLRGAVQSGPIRHDDDMPGDMPADLDEFRIALARRIDALLESEEDAADTDADSGCDDLAAGPA